MSGNYELIIGNKNTSSWSLRPWLLLQAFNIPFKETLIRLRRPQTRSDILRLSPSGKVPAL
jgi:glutathione S-transferase